MKKRYPIILVAIVIIGYSLFIMTSTITPSNIEIANKYLVKDSSNKNIQYLGNVNDQNNSYYCYLYDDKIEVIELLNKWYYMGRLRYQSKTSSTLSDSYPTIVIYDSNTSIIYGKCIAGFDVDIYYKDTLLSQYSNDEYILNTFKGSQQDIKINIRENN